MKLSNILVTPHLGASTVEAQSENAASMLSLYRAGLALRRSAPWSPAGELTWLPSHDFVLAFARGEGFVCLVNFGAAPVELPAGSRVLLASDELEGGAVPQDTTVWLRQTSATTGSASKNKERR